MRRLFTRIGALSLLLGVMAWTTPAQAVAYCMVDIWGYVYHMNVTPAGGGIYNINGAVDVTEWPLQGILSGTYNRNTNTANLTITNPSPDGCVLMSSWFTLTGSRAGNQLNCSWVNDCGGSGSMSGTLAKGTCGPRFGPGTYNPDAPGANFREALAEVNVFPSPATDYVTIDYTLDELMNTEIAVVDLTGRTIDVLENSLQDAGRYQIRWDVTNVPTGLYMVRVNDEMIRVLVEH